MVGVVFKFYTLIWQKKEKKASFVSQPLASLKVKMGETLTCFESTFAQNLTLRKFSLSTVCCGNY